MKFLVAGGIAAIINWGSRFIFSIWFPFEVAVTIAFVFGLLSAFFLMQKYVFTAKNNSLSAQFFVFLLINLLALVITVGVSSLFLRILLPKTALNPQYHEGLAHLLGIIAPIATSFIGHKRLTFR